MKNVLKTLKTLKMMMHKCLLMKTYPRLWFSDETVRQSRRGLLREAKSIQGRTKGDSVHFYKDNQTLCSYWDKGRKPVLLLSTMLPFAVNTYG